MNIIAAAIVSVAAILTSAIVGGRVYAPTYYAQYGGNLQPSGNISKPLISSCNLTSYKLSL